MIDEIFKISKDIRYVAIYRDGKLETQTKDNTEGASSSESDKYEELIANPVMLKAASQRGNIDCGGLDYLLVRYGSSMGWSMVNLRRRTEHLLKNCSAT